MTEAARRPGAPTAFGKSFYFSKNDPSFAASCGSWREFYFRFLRVGRRLLRVIAGRFRRRRLKTLPGEATRPMLDRVRETLFNVLQQQVPGRAFADLYAGTGAVGIEALSRGASRVILVEKSPRAVQVIRENLQMLGSPGNAHVWAMSVARAVPSLDAEIVFLGPPYAADDEYRHTLEELGSRPPAIVIAQHDRKRVLAEAYGALERYRQLPIGSHCLTFYRRAQSVE